MVAVQMVDGSGADGKVTSVSIPHLPTQTLNLLYEATVPATSTSASSSVSTRHCISIYSLEISSVVCVGLCLVSKERHYVVRKQCSLYKFKRQKMNRFLCLSPTEWLDLSNLSLSINTDSSDRMPISVQDSLTRGLRSLLTILLGTEYHLSR